MKNKIICLLLALIMALSVFALSACNQPEDPEDPNEPNGPSKPTGPTLSETWWEDITYPQTELRFKMTKNSNREELGSGCERYLAGTTADDGDIDVAVDERNEDALFNTNVTIKYDYYDDTSDYNWSKCIDVIYNEIQSGSSTTPDMYCNFLTDMLSTSLLGSFANLYSRERGDNFIDRYADGYMGELMESLTLSTEKIYVIASDYFLDLIRAFYVVPVGRQLYDSIAETMPGLEDYDENGKKDINDFFEEIWDLKWTYERLAQYSAKVYSNTSGLSTPNLGDTVGFALSSSSGLSASGMVYTSSVTVIHKEWNKDRNDYDYYYPKDGSEIVALTNALNTLFSSTGVISVIDREGQKWGSDSLQAIRAQFSEGKVLFGGVIMIGSLEYSQYQDMKDNGGFGVVPAPLFRATNPTTGEAEKYQTQIHPVGRAGGIAHTTKKFTQCTAFVQYQSTHSTDILNTYYNENLALDVTDGVDGNVEMLKYIRKNVRSCFDKVFEDSIGFFNVKGDSAAVSNRWHNLISSARYKMTNMDQKYAELYSLKETYLTELVKEYDRLPN